MASQKRNHLPKSSLVEVIKCCNDTLISDPSFNPDEMFHNQWFETYFSFLPNKQLVRHLGEAYYEARFMYSIMYVLHLTLRKNKGFVKFQIIQYVSICEAILDYIIDTYFKAKARESFNTVEYVNCANALSNLTKISYDNAIVALCIKKNRTLPLTVVRSSEKTAFAVENGIITAALKDKLDAMYSTRNNVHILKAATQNYSPTLTEAKESYQMMQDFVEEIKSFLANQETAQQL